VSRKAPPQVGIGTSAYYLVDVAAITRVIDVRISALRTDDSAGEANRESTTPSKSRRMPSGADRSRVGKISTP
jgi:hypothetical protein